jgi:isopentenyldiphosphate isomerase
VALAEELLNVYDADARVIGARPRREAKASGLAVGAVNALVLNPRGEVLLQRRPRDKENGALWDKSVGGHVSAGEDFDTALLREAGEELFDDPGSARVSLLPSEQAYRSALGSALDQGVLLRRVDFRSNLRDVRHAPRGVETGSGLPGGGVRNVLYHVAIYLGRTRLPIESFRPQPSEIAELRFLPAVEVDRLLLEGRLAPNMAFLWLTQAYALLRDGSGLQG